MKKDRKLQCRWKMASGIIVLLLTLWIGFSAEPFTIVSRAESAGKVTVNSAKIRKEPNTSSAALASALKDAKVSIRGKLTGDDGNIWYQVYVDANTLGYVRSDLVEITDGSTPSTVSYTAGDGGTAPADSPGSNENLVETVAVNPVSGSVTGGQAVRVRQNASTTSRIVTTAKSGLALTVIGKAVGTDGKDWYQVSFIDNSSEITGFIRSEYVTVSEELVPAEEATVPDDIDEIDYEPVEPEPEIQKDWDTYYESGKWHLINTENSETYDIENIFKIAEDNKTIAEGALSTQKTQKIIIIVLVILVIGHAAVVCYLAFRIRDMKDSAYYSAVERETVRRRTADRPQRSSQGQRPAGSGQRPAGSSQGQRPSASGQRPVSSSQGQRPAGSAQGQRPVSGGQRPAGSVQGQRPAGSGQRPMGSSQRPAGSGQRPAGESQSQRPVSQRRDGMSSQQERMDREPVRKSKNFLEDEEEFEYKFMDWDKDDSE